MHFNPHACTILIVAAAGDDLFGQPDEVENSALFGTSKKGGLFDDDEETESAAAVPSTAAAPKEDEPVVTRGRSGDYAVPRDVLCTMSTLWSPHNTF